MNQSLKNVGAILVSTACLATATTAASFQGLGYLSGATSNLSSAAALSADGTTVTGYSNSDLGHQAFIWTQSTGMAGLGDLPGGSFASFGHDVSGDGSIIVGGGNSASGTEGFVWTNGLMTAFADLPGGTTVGGLAGISADGTTIIGTSNSEAFRWTESDGMVGLGDLPGGSFTSSAADVSADGSVIVGNSSSDLGSEPYICTSGTGMVGLGLLPGYAYTTASAVSSDGSTVVGTARGYDEESEAFLWTSSTGMIGLGDIPGGEFYSGANAVSADGSIVVGFGDPEFGPWPEYAMIWDEVHGARWLQEVLINEYGLGDELDGWHLSYAIDVSDDGTVITGVGYGPDGRQQAWIAVIPEPTSVMLVAAGCLGFIKRS